MVGAIQDPGAEPEPRELGCSVGGVPVMRAVRRAVGWTGDRRGNAPLGEDHPGAVPLSDDRLVKETPRGGVALLKRESELEMRVAVFVHENIGLTEGFVY